MWKEKEHVKLDAVLLNSADESGKRRAYELI